MSVRSDSTGPMEFSLRQASIADVDSIRELIDASVRGLAKDIYTDDQIEQSIRSVFGVDRTLIEDGTYFVAVLGTEIVGCGGWSYRQTLFGGDARAERDPAELDPDKDAAKIRAFFIDPDYARRGIGRALLEEAARHALAGGASALTLTTFAQVPWNAPYYSRCGFRVLDESEWTPGLRVIREREAAHGLDRWPRVCMRRDLA